MKKVKVENPSKSDLTHLDALRNRLYNERQHLARATSQKEKLTRQTWIAQIEKEIIAEQDFLGGKIEQDASNDDLLRELTNSRHKAKKNPTSQHRELEKNIDELFKLLDRAKTKNLFTMPISVALSLVNTAIGKAINLIKEALKGV